MECDRVPGVTRRSLGMGKRVLPSGLVPDSGPHRSTTTREQERGRKGDVEPKTKRLDTRSHDGNHTPTLSRLLSRPDPELADLGLGRDGTGRDVDRTPLREWRDSNLEEGLSTHS